MAPALAASAAVVNTAPPGASRSTRNLFEKSSPPVNKLSGGMMMSFTKDAIIPPKAAPMITPTAMSTAFPLIANSLNSLSMIQLYLAGHDIDKLFWDNNDLANRLSANGILHFLIGEGRLFERGVSRVESHGNLVT